MLYADVKNETVVNVVVSDPDFAIKQGWIAIAESVGVGWTWNGSEWVNPSPPIIDSADSIDA